MTKFWIGIVCFALVVLGGLLFFYHEDIVLLWDETTTVVEELPVPKLDPDEVESKWDNYLNDLDKDLNSKKEEAMK